MIQISREKQKYLETELSTALDKSAEIAVSLGIRDEELLDRLVKKLRQEESNEGGKLPLDDEFHPDAGS